MENTDNVAAGVAEAVADALNGRTVADEPKGPTNPLMKFFDLDGIGFEPIDNSQTYTARGTGVKTTAIADVFIPIRGTDLVMLGGRIHLQRYPSKKIGSIALFKWNQRNGIKPLDEAARDVHDEFRRAVVNLFNTRNGDKPITAGVSAAAVAVKANWTETDDE